MVMQHVSVWGHKTVHSIDQWDLQDLHFEVCLNKTKQNKTENTDISKRRELCVHWQMETRTHGLPSPCVIPGQSLRRPGREPLFLPLCSVDNAKEEAAIKDNQEGTIWNEDLGNSHTSRLRARAPALHALPLGVVQAGGMGMGPLRKKGDTGVSH